jgi:2-hydroxy-3-oxopropionate reductase
LDKSGTLHILEYKKMLNPVGFIGLGQMGKWMALNLVKHKFDLKVYDIDENVMACLVDRGAQPARSPAELAETTNFIILSLPDSGVVEKVVCGTDGIVHGAKVGQIVVDCGTSGYLWTQEFAKSLQEKGIRFVDAPVTGMEKRASEGTLTIMFGGDDEILEAIRPLLEAMGKEIVHMGNVGNG